MAGGKSLRHAHFFIQVKKMNQPASGCALETLCQMPLGKHRDPYGAISYPIYQSATFAHRSVAQPGDFDYSRVQNPTREQLEATVCALEGGADAIAFASGMAAIAALMELFQPGAHLIVDADLYGGTTRLFNAISVNIYPDMPNDMAVVCARYSL